jgi:hypothetical protein
MTAWFNLTLAIDIGGPETPASGAASPCPDPYKEKKPL